MVIISDFQSDDESSILFACSCIFGALVQLVRAPACHAGGHEFESRTHRFIKCPLSSAG